MTYGDPKTFSEIEFTVEHTTPKAALIVPTNTDTNHWLPKSQSKEWVDLGGGKWSCMAADWWLEKEGIVVKGDEPTKPLDIGDDEVPF